jgi:hypothetical protein
VSVSPASTSTAPPEYEVYVTFSEPMDPTTHQQYDDECHDSR